jgi:ATP-binding cassette subfamily B protein
MRIAFPRVAFFGEPAASLAATTGHALFERHARAARAGSARGAVAVPVTRRFSTVPSANLLLVVGDGGVTEPGSHDERIARGGPCAELHRFQGPGACLGRGRSCGSGSHSTPPGRRP